MADYRPEANADASQIESWATQGNGQLKVKGNELEAVGTDPTVIQMPATPDNSVTTGVNAGPLQVPSGQPIEAEGPVTITNPGVPGDSRLAGG